MSEPEVIICPDPEALAFEAAEQVLRAGADAIAQRGRFMLALSGGSTPEATYSRLAEPERAARFDWAKTYFLFGDERFVPQDDTRSNYLLATRAMLSKVPVAVDHIFPIPTNRPTPADSAAAYVHKLAQAFGIPPDGPPPRFDLVLLGLGDDGHTCSLFPHASSLHEEQAWVTSSPPGTLPPPVDRVTLTFPVLNAARRVLFLVAGGRKAAVVRDVLEGRPPASERPAAGVRPTDGALVWLLDAAAAGMLRQS
jgi:6-phosphogluconolactonase